MTSGQPHPASSGAPSVPRRFDLTQPLLVDGLLAFALAATVGALSWSAAVDLRMPGWERSVLAAALVVLHAAVAPRRRWPWLSFAAASVAMAVVVVLPNATGSVVTGPPAATVPLLLLPSSLLYALLIASVAAVEPARRSLWPLGSGLVGIAVAGPRLYASGLAILPGSGWAFAFVLLSLVAVVVASWLVGRLMAARTRARFTERAHAVERAVSRERAEIAREVHDVVAHSLAVIVRQAEAGSYVASVSPQKAQESLTVVAETGRAALADMRSVLAPLRLAGAPSVAADNERAGDTASTHTLAAVNGLLASVRSAGLDVRWQVVGSARPLPTPADLAAYRVLQEGLTNCLKHAGSGARAEAGLRWGADTLEVSVLDDGADATARVPGTGLGLAGLRERLAGVGGELSAGPREEGGFAVHVRIPLPPPAER